MTRDERNLLKESVEAAIDALVRRGYPQDEVLDAFESVSVYRKKIAEQERARARREAVMSALAGSRDPATPAKAEPKRRRKVSTNGVAR